MHLTLNLEGFLVNVGVRHQKKTIDFAIFKPEGNRYTKMVANAQTKTLQDITKGL
jgi:hypothetical protein